MNQFYMNVDIDNTPWGGNYDRFLNMAGHASRSGMISVPVVALASKLTIMYTLRDDMVYHATLDAIAAEKAAAEAAATAEVPVAPDAPPAETAPAPKKRRGKVAPPVVLEDHDADDDDEEEDAPVPRAPVRARGRVTTRKPKAATSAKVIYTARKFTSAQTGVNLSQKSPAFVRWMKEHFTEVPHTGSEYYSYNTATCAVTGCDTCAELSDEPVVTPLLTTAFFGWRVEYTMYERRIALYAYAQTTEDAEEIRSTYRDEDLRLIELRLTGNTRRVDRYNQHTFARRVNEYLQMIDGNRYDVYNADTGDLVLVTARAQLHNVEFVYDCKNVIVPEPKWLAPHSGIEYPVNHMDHTMQRKHKVLFKNVPAKFFEASAIAPEVSKLKNSHVVYEAKRFTYTTGDFNIASQIDSQRVPLTFDEFIAAWSGTLVRDLRSKRQHAHENLLAIQRELMEASHKFGQVDLVVRSVESGSNDYFVSLMTKIKEIPDIVSLDFKPTYFEFTTRPYFAEFMPSGRSKWLDRKYWLGSYSVRISIGAMEIQVRANNAKSNWAVHPHRGTSDDGGFCLSGYHSVFSAAYQGADYMSLVLSVIEYLKTVNEQDSQSTNRLGAYATERIAGKVTSWVHMFSTQRDDDNAATRRATRAGRRVRDDDDDDDDED